MNEQSQNVGVDDAHLVAGLSDAVDRMRYTYKTHEKAADRYELWETWRRWALIVCTVLATGTFVAALFDAFGFTSVGQVVTGTLAALSALTSMLGDFLDFGNQAREHSAAGKKVRSLFIAYENLLGDYLDGAIALDAARVRRDELAAQEDQILDGLPRTTRKDYEAADKALTIDERTSSHQDQLTEPVHDGGTIA